MARDLAATPFSGIMVQLSGDAHCANFGAFAIPERNVIFDVRDFDDAARAVGMGSGTFGRQPGPRKPRLRSQLGASRQSWSAFRTALGVKVAFPDRQRSGVHSHVTFGEGGPRLIEVSVPRDGEVSPWRFIHPATPHHPI